MLRCAGRGAAGRVDAVLELLARLEARRLARRNLDRLAGLRVAARARRRLADTEGAEAAQVDLVTAGKRVRHQLEDVFHELLHLSFRRARLGGDLVDDVGLLHFGSLPRVSASFVWRRAS